MGTTNGGLYQYGGQPVAGAIGASPFGKAFFVDYEKGSDTNNGTSPEAAVKTLSQAVSLSVSNRGDIIFIDPYAAVVETAMVDISKNRLTIVGGAPPYGHYGPGARIQIGSTDAATDIACMKNTGVRNKFIGLKFDNGNDVAEGLYGVAEAGEYSIYCNCEFYKSEDLDDAGAAELLLNGDSAQFYNCTFGSNVNETGNIHANVLCTATISGKKLRDCYFENCLFWGKADDTDKNFIYGANATDVERMLMLKDCTFFNTELASGTPTACITFGAKQTEGLVFLKNCSAVNCGDIAADDVGIWIDGAAPTEATSGIAVELAS